MTYDLEALIQKIQHLKKTDIGGKINSRIKEFESFKKSTNNELFSELCFCILTANFNAERSIKIQNEVGQCFFSNSKEEIQKNLQNYGHRFANKRSEYIIESQKCKNQLNNVLNSLKGENLRKWIADNIKGLGYKEASHFLRNIGYEDYAIIDFHIIDILERYDIINRPKSLTKKKYIEIEKTLRNIAKKVDLNLAELDLYLWYLETGKILK